MTETIDPKDQLARRIALRKQEAEAQAAKLAGRAPAIQPTPALAPVRPVLGSDGTNAVDPAHLAALQDALAKGYNSLDVARLLSAALQGGASREDLRKAIDKSKSWLSKKLQLLNAPRDVQKLIESGELSESEYYADQALPSRIKGKGDTLRLQRMSRVTIYSEAARDLAAILQHHAQAQGAAPIKCDSANLKDLTNILNLRAGEIRRALKL